MSNSGEDSKTKETWIEKLTHWLKGQPPFLYIIVSLVLISVWGVIGQTVGKEKTVILLVNIVIAAIGSYGTYLRGELSLHDSLKIQQDKYRLHARSRYRRLDDFFWETYRISQTIVEAQVKSLSETERLRILSGVPDRMEALMRNISNSMRTWKDFAPDELEELHRELFDVDEEE
ncbi:MAG: hypothetical protein OXL96_24680 [Candidatus Poribacteria bacterium]|nr:hypothetical protein [Candidatus Poribacteria bacterium]